MKEQRHRDGVTECIAVINTLTLRKKTCPRVLQALAGCIGMETFLGAFGGGGGGGARGKVFICAQKQLCMLPVLVIL